MGTGSSCITRDRVFWQPTHLWGKAPANTPFLAWLRDRNTCWKWCPWQGPTQPPQRTSATGRVSGGSWGSCVMLSPPQLGRLSSCRGKGQGWGWECCLEAAGMALAVGSLGERRGEQAIQLPFGTSPSPLPFSQALRKFLAWEIWGSQAFFFSFFRNVEIADKHNKPFHVLIPTVPALCLGNPEVSAPTLSQPLAGYWESHAEPFRQVSDATC